jgi:hypothetical protein
MKKTNLLLHSDSTRNSKFKFVLFEPMLERNWISVERTPRAIIKKNLIISQEDKNKTLLQKIYSKTHISCKP